ncbi:MAG: hypothetical protein OQK75_08045 [Gammaproteobacteria bacterium]|nr:hypothetical protein [Gammaproteobacteria bacterium]MCW8987607.1 hypothetical protein [Gammaproteobacteria bacterium]MCW9032050.1 hypothetical protein [Gammaproteobacteria bacterium]
MRELYTSGINIRILIIFISFFFILSCTPNSDVNKPVELIWDKPGNKTDEIIVFLPGLYDVADIFQKEQFFILARKAGIKADMVAASIHINHLLKEMVVERIEQDIFNPAIKNGYKNIWFVGVSLGALNSLLFYKKYEKDICGVVVLAPYLGDKVLTEEISNMGGIENGKPAVLVENNGRYKDKKIVDRQLQQLWFWFEEQKSKNNLNKIFIGYGNEDRYVEVQSLFSGILPKQNVTMIKGEHEWKTGRKLWQQQLSSRFETGLLKPCK